MKRNFFPSQKKKLFAMDSSKLSAPDLGDAAAGLKRWPHLLRPSSSAAAADVAASSVGGSEAATAVAAAPREEDERDADVDADAIIGRAMAERQQKHSLDICTLSIC